MRYIDMPAKVIGGTVTSAIGLDMWPYDDGSNDPYWEGGSKPRAYRWEIVMDVTPQQHSSHRTRRPYWYDGTDISVGCYIASQTNGIALEIVSILEKTPTMVRCIVEDVLRYNTFRDPRGQGSGIFSTPAVSIVFETNESGFPVVDPIPATGVGELFYPNLMSRFENVDQNFNFMLYKPNHGFEVDDLISADSVNHTFVKSDSSHPYVIGKVTYTEFGPDHFMLSPIQKVDSKLPSLPGNVGDVLYVSKDVPGQYSLTGLQPVLVKLRDNTTSWVIGKKTGVTTEVGNTFEVNRIRCTVGGTGSPQDFVDAVNQFTLSHKVTATLVLSETDVSTSLPLFYGEPAFDLTTGAKPTAIINGVVVEFITTDMGMQQYGVGYCLEEDMVSDINSYNIPNVVASYSNNKITIKNLTGGEIRIENGLGDSSGVMFAGNNSASGLVEYTAASSNKVVRLDADDARAIDLLDVSGTTIDDFGLFSVENGKKAAAMFIEQGIRKADTYVVATIAARDSLNVMFGDQCFVENKGNDEWGHYIYTLDDVWVKIADKDSSETDSQTASVEITAGGDIYGEIHKISNGRRVTFVTVNVLEPFDGPATVEVGDNAIFDRLMGADQSDLNSVGSYSTTPSFVYSTGSDVGIVFNFNPAGSVTGRAKVAISYT